MKIELQRVHYMPKELIPGVLYVSEEFGVAKHLCASGCGLTVVTPLDPTEWSLEVKNNKPTLYPSIGNWDLPCQSHYWIRDGEIIWAGKWTSEQIAAGRRAEEERRNLYYNNLDRKRGGHLKRLWGSIISLFKK